MHKTELISLDTKGFAQEALKNLAELQPLASKLLLKAAETRQFSSTYLFVGPAGSGKRACARALAEAYLCADKVDECLRIEHGTHPDVRQIQPKSAKGYLIAQIRELLEDSKLSPIRLPGKVYIIDQAEMLLPQAANALLKSLEEPPQNLMFILLAQHAERLLPTIVSRCQKIPFVRSGFSTSAAFVQKRTGATSEELRLALGLGLSAPDAVQFLRSGSRRARREDFLRLVDSLLVADSWDLIQGVKTLLQTAELPPLSSVPQLSAEQEEEFLGKLARKQRETQMKRDLNLAERKAAFELISVLRSLLRDVLFAQQGFLSKDFLPQNPDVPELIAKLSRALGIRQCADLLKNTTEALDELYAGVQLQLIFEKLLLSLKLAIAAHSQSLSS